MIKFKKQIFGFSAVAAMLAMSACTNNDDPSMEVIPQFGEGDGNVVTISVMPENIMGGTRALVDPSNTISNGDKADILLFAVYRKKAGETTYSLADSYQKDEHKSITPTGSTTNIDAGTGQNIFKIDNKETFFPYRIQIVTEEGYSYKVAFWAQSSKTNVFNTSDLSAVTVNYSGILNNYELMDAFCGATEDITGGQTTGVHAVIMKRPFAQINLGTTGADYKNIMTSEYLYPTLTIQKTRVEIDGACNQIDVLTGKISSASGFSEKVTFNWEKLAAYVNINTLPTVVTGNDIDTKYANLLKATNEEMLYVKMNKTQNEFEDYLTSYPTVEKDENGKITKYKTEVFKYLSMCYVLVASDGYPVDNRTNKNTTLKKVTFNLGNKDAVTATEPDSKFTISINNVPVQRNWRTNVLCGLSDTDTDIPEDETSLVSTAIVCVHLDPIYDAEQSGIIEDGKIKNEWIETVFPGVDDDDEEDSLHDKYDHDDDESYNRKTSSDSGN